MEPSERLEVLLRAVGDRRRAVICIHNNPDPDGIASAQGLKVLLARAMGVRSQIIYGGEIGRASNRAMVAQCRIDLRRVRALPPLKRRALLLVDAQPGSGHSLVPRRATVDVVIDHHRAGRPSGARPVGYRDVRPDVGACSTIVAEYLQAAGITPDKRLATALFYGIRTDIGDLGRERAERDLETLVRLFPLVSQKLLARIESPRLARTYFQRIRVCLDAAIVYRDVVTTRLGEDGEPDTVAELADLLLRLEGMRWSLVCGIHEGALIFSLRTLARDPRAGSIAARLAGRSGSAGGHSRSAAGQIPLEALAAREGQGAPDPEAALILRFLTLVRRADAVPQPLRSRQGLATSP